MNPQLESALTELRDIHLPPTPGWWPPAPGWWIVGLLGVVLITFLALWIRRRWQRNRPVRAYRRAVRSVALSPESVVDNLGYLSSLTRQLAITLRGRTAVAGMTGERWLGLLDELSGTHDFSDGPGRMLATGPYQQGEASDLEPLRRCLLRLDQRRR